MTDTKKSLAIFADVLSNVDDVSSFVTGVMRQFDELKESGQRSEIELGLEDWLRPPERKGCEGKPCLT